MSDGDDEAQESDEERAEELAHEAAEENPDPITYREVLEGELEEECGTSGCSSLTIGGAGPLYIT